MIKYYSINGEITPKENAVIGINDLGFLRGYAVFDFFRVLNGQPVFLEDHLERFHNSANYMGLEIPYSDEVLVEKMQQLIELNGNVDCGIKIMLTGGYSENGYNPTKPNLVMLASYLPTYPESIYTKGIKLMSYQYTRDTPYNKTTNYLVPIQLLKQIKEAEAMDVLYHDGTYISESARSNFFIFDDKGTLITPDKDALEGITRKNILKVARNHFNVEVRPLSLKETMKAKEAFMCSSTKGVLPVRQVDFWRINKHIIGENTKKLSQLFKEHVAAYLAERVSV